MVAAVQVMSFQISPPEQFNIDQPENWAPWIRRFERYRLASKLNDESEKSQVNMLMYLLGDKADSILSSFRLNEEQSNSYDTVKQKFQDYFNVRHNVICERAKFNLRKQEVGESVDDFLTSLHTLVETCNYGNLRDEMIRDRIVVGILDKSLAERLQLDAALTLDGCIKLVRGTDVVKKQQKLLAAHANDFAMAGIQNKRKTGNGVR